MEQAIKWAKRAAEMNEVPVGALVVLDDEVIGIGHNQPISTNDPTAHAEMIALRQAANTINNYRLMNTTLYVTLEPCLMCAGALYWSKIGRVVFGADDEKNGYRRMMSPLTPYDHSGTGPWPFHPKTLLVNGVLKDECSLLMTEFFRNKR